MVLLTNFVVVCIGSRYDCMALVVGPCDPVLGYSVGGGFDGQRPAVDGRDGRGDDEEVGNLHFG